MLAVKMISEVQKRGCISNLDVVYEREKNKKES